MLATYALRAELMSKHWALEDLGDPEGSRSVALPLLEGCFSLGARICREAAWDPTLDTTGYFALVPVERIAPR